MRNHAAIVEALWQATLSGEPTASVALENPEMSLSDAYQIFDSMAQKRIDSGAIIIGRKLGLTAAASMKNFGIREPVHGLLFSNGAVANGATIKIGGQVSQPKLESEIGFIMGQDVDAIPSSIAQLTASIDAVVPCYEIAGSRIEGWPKKVEDLIADSCGFCSYILGEGRAKPTALDLSNIAINIQKNGQNLATGTGAECMGNPLNALMWLVEKLVAKGDGLKRGDFILTGALGGVHPVKAGDTFESSFEGLGDVSVRFS